MKRISGLAVGLCVFFAAMSTSLAWFKVGTVFCDTNLNSQIDGGDVGLPGVLVVVTNTSGTFSNANWTQPDGVFVVELPPAPDSYVDFIDTATLPPGTLLVTPLQNSFQTLAAQTSVTNDFLVQSLACLPGPFVSAGSVLCDVNTNGLADSADLPLPGVLVVATNLLGTSSNATFTGPDGRFLLVLPEAGNYGEFLLDTTLPPQSVVLTPPGGVSLVTVNPLPNNPVDISNFLVASPACVTTVTNRCWLSGGGTIRVGKGAPLHSFGGVVYPGCKPNAAGGGNWNDLFHGAGLHFKTLSIEVLNCGNAPGYAPGSASPITPFNFIEFQGVGTLKGVGRNKVDFGLVYFFARCEDHGEPGKGVDRYYLRVFDAENNVLLVVTTNPGNPLEVAPVPISTGNLQLHASGCDRSREGSEYCEKPDKAGKGNQPAKEGKTDKPYKSKKADKAGKDKEAGKAGKGPDKKR